MPKFNCSYAYSISHYYNFVVEADTEESANEKIEAALRDGTFDNVPCEADADAFDNRVFCTGEASEADAQGQDTLTDDGLKDCEGEEVGL